MPKPIIWVDIPVKTEEGMNWTNVAEFSSKEEALAWIRKHIDSNCDDEGRISLLYFGEDYKQEEET